MGEKEQLLTNLYSLRAGLSVVSQNKDSVETIKNDTDSQLDRVQNNLYRKVNFVVFNDDVETVVSSGQFETQIRRYSDRQRNDRNKQLAECKQELAVEEKTSASAPDKIKKERKKRGKAQARGKFGFFLLSILALALCALFVWWTGWRCPARVGEAEHFLGELFWEIAIFVCGLSALVSLGFGIYFFVKVFTYESSSKDADRLANEKYKADKTAKQLRERIKYLENLPDKTSEYLGLIPLGQQAVDERKKLREKANSSMQPLMQIAIATVKTLENLYSKTLDQRDWMYLDLIIYYIETNRADTIKEALSMVDRERQTQQIVASVQQATNAICQTISSETSTLRQSISAGFTQLSSVIREEFATLTAEVSKVNDSIREGFAEANAIASAQLTQITITNAMLAKANATSEQLASDVSFVRSNHYYNY